MFRKHWSRVLLLALIASPACRHASEPARSEPELGADAGTDTDRPGLSPDTGAPIGPVAGPVSLAPYQLPPGGGGQGGSGGMAPIGGAGSGGAAGRGIGNPPRRLYAL